MCRHPRVMDLRLRSFSFRELDLATDEWVLRCAIGKLQANVDVSLLQFRIELTSIRARVSRAGDVFCSLEFLAKEARDTFLKQNVELLEPWFDGLVV